MLKTQNKNILIIASLIIINIIAYWLYFRFDITQDKRFSIAEPSKKILKSLNNPVVIKVYLDGDNLPGGFERLKRSIDETLQEFKRYGSDNIDIDFVDPLAGTEEEKKVRFKTLVEKGMQPTNIFDNKNGQKTEVIVFPYATVWQNNKELTLQLLKGRLSEDPQTRLNQSAEIAEHTFITAINKLNNDKKKKVALLAEFTSLKPENFAGLITSLQDQYNLFILEATKSPTFVGIDALIIPKPDKPFDDSTKFKIDQYLMSGGKILFFVDGLKVDTVGLEGSYAQPLNINIDDMLFKYGVKINKNIVKDGLNAAVIPMVVGNMGDKPNFQPVPYRFYPLINDFGPSLITKNIDMVITKYAANIETVNNGDGLKKTPLLLTSPYTKLINAPALITFNEARTETEEKSYNAGVKSLAYLVEGKFSSLFKNSFSQKVIGQSPDTKILVCSDGDLIVNELDRKNGIPFPLGFDRYAQHQYGNQDFVMNAINYMLDEGGIISSRAKSLQLRPLDKLKVRNERLQWQLVNIALPLIILVLAAAARFYYVKRKWEV